MAIPLKILVVYNIPKIPLLKDKTLVYNSTHHLFPVFSSTFFIAFCNSNFFLVIFALTSSAPYWFNLFFGIDFTTRTWL